MGRKRRTSSDRVRELNNPAKASYQKGKRKKKKKNRGRKFGRFLVAVQAILTFVFLGILMTLNLLPFKFTMVIAGILLFFLILTYATQRRHKRKALPGKLLSMLLILILGFGSYYLGMLNGAFDKIIGGDHKVDNMVVLVLNNNPAESLEDAKDYTFATQFELGGEDISKAIEEINEELDTEIMTVEYEDMYNQATALWVGNVDAIIMNEGYIDMMEESLKGFQKGTKVIYSCEIKKELANNNVDVKVTNETFSVYLSGIDVSGSIQKTSRSDVNIIATVNPETHQILLTTTPRDFYVPIPNVSNGQKDKLTHAGLYGVDASIATLENLYETTIPFYARVNFTSIIEIVDALGGIDVYSEYEFTTSVDSIKVQKGMNHFNGEEALAFSRERYNVPGGDNQRGKNQQAVIVAMIKKMISPQILVSAGDIIESVSGNVETNMSQAQIQELIKTQLREGGAWNIYSVAAEGTGSSNYTYSMPGRKLYVTEPNVESVENIKTLMERVENGEILDGSEVAQ